jgi:hypothetical protein
LALLHAPHRQMPACASKAGASSTVTHSGPSGHQITTGMRGEPAGGVGSSAGVSVGRLADWLNSIPLEQLYFDRLPGLEALGATHHHAIAGL